MAIIKRKISPSVPGGSAEKSDKKPTLHDMLVLKAERWLRTLGCGAIVRDPFRAVLTREKPDAIGWRDGLSVLVEVKTSRADFLADAKKPFRANPELGMGDWRFYMCPPEIINESELPEGWGLVWVKDSRIVKRVGVPPNTVWHRDRPFSGNKDEESILLASALSVTQKNLKEAFKAEAIVTPNSN